MKQSTPHADYGATPHAHRWRRGSLSELFSVLKREALNDRGSWKWRVLWSGAQVAMRTEGDRLRLRIARRDKPKNPVTGVKAFERECQTFRAEFGCLEWEGELIDTPGIAMSFLSPAPKQEALDLGGVADDQPASALAEGR